MAMVTEVGPVTVIRKIKEELKEKLTATQLPEMRAKKKEVFWKWQPCREGVFNGGRHGYGFAPLHLNRTTKGRHHTKKKKKKGPPPPAPTPSELPFSHHSFTHPSLQSVMTPVASQA